MQDTVRGLNHLGISKRVSRCLACILHLVFSYPTSPRWRPTFDLGLPIEVDNLTKTRWGKNWGKFSRVDWIVDLDLNNVSLLIIGKY